MTIRIVHESSDEYFYLRFPGSKQDVYVSGERIVVGPWHLEGIHLAELRSVAMRLRRRYETYSSYAEWASDDEGATFQVFAGVPEDYLDVHDDLPVFADADLIAGRTGVRVRVLAQAKPGATAGQVRRLADTAAAECAGRVRSAAVEWENIGGDTWAIDAEFRRRDALASALLALGKSISTAVGELAGEADADGVVNVIAAGYPAGLIGLAENDWLEAKSEPWNLDSDRGKIELAQDVARLANANGGVIVVGAATRKEDGKETVTRVDGVRPELFRPHRVRMTIDARVYPPVEGIKVGRSDISQSPLSVGYIQVPPQDPGCLPFLVHGAIVGRRVDGSFISIVRRRGDQSISVRAEEMHAWLAAGRRLLRQGTVDDSFKAGKKKGAGR
jgi:hypothetical protein